MRRFRRSALGIRALPLEVRALIGVGFMVALGFGVVAPAIPLFAREFGVGRTAAGAVVSAFAFIRLLAAPFAGRLVTWFGERVMLATGIGIVAVSSLLAGFAQDYWQLLVLRGAGGAGSIMFSVSSASLLIRVTPEPPARPRPGRLGRGVPARPDRRAGGRHGGDLVAARPVLPLRRHPGRRRLAGPRHACGTLSWPPGSERADPMPLREALRHRAYLAALVAAFAGDFAVVGSRAALVPQFVTDRLQLGTGWVYAAFLVVSVVSGALLLPFGRIADARGRRPVIVGGLAVGAVGFALLPVVPGIGGLLFAMALLGVAGAADSVAPGAMMGDVVAGRGGTVVAVFQMAGDLGQSSVRSPGGGSPTGTGMAPRSA